MWELGEGDFWVEGNVALQDGGGTLEEGNGVLEEGSGALEEGDGALGEYSGVLDDYMVGGGEALVHDEALLGMLGPRGVLEGMADRGDLQAGI